MSGGSRVPAVFWVLVPVLVVCAWQAYVIHTWTGGEPLPEPWLYNVNDVKVYFHRAVWVRRGTPPYADVFSEYPLLPTLAFAIPRWWCPRIALPEYQVTWSTGMALVYLGLIGLVARARQGLGLSPRALVVLASPTLPYFAITRFDVVAALVTAASVWLLHRDRRGWAMVLLGVAVHIKWYPAVLFPVFVAYAVDRQDQPGGRLRALFSGEVLRLGSIFVAVTLGLVVLTVQISGWDGFLVPYRFHMVDRGAQYFNPYWVAEQLGWTGWSWTSRAFFLLQVGVMPVLLLFWRIPTSHAAFRASVVAVWLFVTFAKVDSPQWILWTVPLALMFARERRTLVALGVATVLNYVVFPGMFRLHMRGHDLEFSAFVLAKDVALFLAVLWAAREADPVRASEVARGVARRLQR